MFWIRGVVCDNEVISYHLPRTLSCRLRNEGRCTLERDFVYLVFKSKSLGQPNLSITNCIKCSNLNSYGMFMSLITGLWHVHATHHWPLIDHQLQCDRFLIKYHARHEAVALRSFTASTHISNKLMQGRGQNVHVSKHQQHLGHFPGCVCQPIIYSSILRTSNIDRRVHYATEWRKPKKRYSNWSPAG